MTRKIPNHKLLMGLTILCGFIAIFSLGVGHASAATTSTLYVSTQGNDNWNGLSSTHTSGVNGPKATIKNAVSKVATDGTVYIASGTYNENNININKNLALKGADQKSTIVNGANKGRIFIISSSAKVTISKLTITNGYSNSAGGAIENQGTLTVNTCKFTKNNVKGTYSDGGAIENKGTLKANSCNFTYNTAYYGGAIYNMKNATISSCNFYKNTATTSGGAISNYLYSLNITSTSFTSNKATSSGGAIESQGPLTIIGSTFTTNTVPGKDGCGGAIDSKCSINLENCKFTGNSVTPNVTINEGLEAYGDTGGAIVNQNGSSSINTFTNVTFTNNISPYGGAIDNYRGTLNLVNCTFQGNKACVNGAAIENEGTGILNVSQGTTFTDNIAGWGGAIFNCYKCTANGITFTGNKATKAGGALVNQGVSFNIISCTITDSSASHNGGAIANTGTMTIKSSTIKYCHTTIDGGAIDNQGKLTIESSKFYKNTVTSTNDGNGGAIENQGTLTISNGCTFTNNHAYYGGAIYNMKTATINNSTFSGNTANSGGAISNYNTAINVTGCTFTSNKATNSGGAIENQKGTLTVKSSEFISNSVTSSGGCGGAIYSKSGTCNADSSNTFTSNTASYGKNIYKC